MSDAPLPSSFDGNEDFYSENRMQKLTRRLREEPLIPLGCLLTCWALIGASRAMKAGDHHQTNRMFRRRIYAQGFTIVAMAAGSMYWSEDRERRKEFDALQQQKKAVEKRDAWLRELEARDEEDKAMRARLEKRRAAKREREREARAGAKEGGGEGEGEGAAGAEGAGVTEAKSVVEGGEGRPAEGGVVAAVKDLFAGKK
ncbi:mitochondrial hypoxia responsive domain containing protein [Diplodia corticola]|uniref:Mitochondrial hypoxia responsive domain containing protein n=1 Tax=Diplodia corticola TaxID=236234 RepID=A0A1J9RPJ7_9PEZI|nr:mitochondrial hypoxia responsive domain containing protein [Diplodia corticola]OJD29493.1 mitochondrial hypoxia responsive domain containing protein [Diplodia corticola]